jgi:hypothetical protein
LPGQAWQSFFAGLLNFAAVDRVVQNLQSIRKSIPLNEISKIEIQDGHKNYHYSE